MRIGIPSEVHQGERRVAVAPETVAEFKKLGLDVLVESGAGVGADMSDEAFKAAGAEISTDTRQVWGSTLVLKVRPPEMNPHLGVHEADLLAEGGALISFIYPARNKDLLDRLAARKATVLAMDMVPRISRAQKMDALSSMANIAGYRAVIEAAHEFGRFFTGQITAAGKVPPAKVLVIGAGVAGLAAIGAAKGLGAIVRAFDTRPEVADQVKSMGAEFLEVDFKEDGTGVGGYAKVMSPEFLKAEMALFKKQAAEVDIVITTALVPGTKAPILWTREHVAAMKPGSVIVDLAAEQGGNCELTQPGKVAEVNGVRIVGYEDLASRLPNQASKLLGTNMAHFLKEMKIDKGWNVDLENEVIRGALVTYQGAVTYPPPKPKVDPSAVAKQQTAAKAAPAPAPKAQEPPHPARLAVSMAAAAVLFALVGATAPAAFLPHFTVFVLAIFIGYMVVWNVTHALHTPLMSVTNAISGIIVVGAMLQISQYGFNSWITWVAAVGVFLASINVFGGFLVTRRMLQMFRK